MSEENGFVEGSHENAYDARGNFTAQPVSFPSDSPDDVIVDAAPQVAPVKSEDSGFKAKGGNTRDAIRERIRNLRPYSSKIVEVEGWGTFELRSMSLGARNEMMMNLMVDGSDTPDLTRMYPAILIACTFDMEGEKVFTFEDEGWLNSLDSNQIDTLAKPAMELSGMAEKAVEKAAGKSDSTEASE